VTVPPAGYSGKSVIAKIGLKPGQTLAVVGPPPHFEDLVEPLPEGAKVHTGYDGDADVVWVFVRDRAELEFCAPQVIGAKQGASIWISWPKKASRMFRDLTEDGVRAVLLQTGWVDVKVAAVDADWSGLKFLRRRK
jgi:hypothetical protein